MPTASDEWTCRRDRAERKVGATSARTCADAGRSRAERKAAAPSALKARLGDSGMPTLAAASDNGKKFSGHASVAEALGASLY